MWSTPLSSYGCQQFYHIPVTEAWRALFGRLKATRSTRPPAPPNSSHAPLDRPLCDITHIISTQSTSKPPTLPHQGCPDLRNANRNQRSRGRFLLHGDGTFSTLKVGGWRLVVGGRWGLAVGGWRLVAVGSGWRLAVGGWRLVIPGAVLKGCPRQQKNWLHKDSPVRRRTWRLAVSPPSHTEADFFWNMCMALGNLNFPLLFLLLFS